MTGFPTTISSSILQSVFEWNRRFIAGFPGDSAILCWLAAVSSTAFSRSDGGNQDCALVRCEAEW